MTTYALFTGCRLGDCEPELVVKLYDSLRFQIPDIDINCMCCGVSALKEDDMTGADEMAVQIRTSWEKMGRPTFVCACPTCIKTLNEKLPEIPTVSLYKILIDLGISGGCNSDPYYLWEDDEWIKSLAEDMGADIHARPENTSDAEYPYITCNINVRNMLLASGSNAVHILELIFGMGDSTVPSPEQMLRNRRELTDAMLELCDTEI